jgi:hypothetical protein
MKNLKACHAANGIVWFGFESVLANFSNFQTKNDMSL